MKYEEKRAAVVALQSVREALVRESLIITNADDDMRLSLRKDFPKEYPESQKESELSELEAAIDKINDVISTILIA